MSDDYIIGVDIKCGQDAAVFVFLDNPEDLPDREQSTQILARGQRARGTYYGVMFVKDLIGKEI